MPHFNIIHGEAIDKAQWNDCIMHSETPNIYGLSFFLDSISPGWRAIVAHDYGWVLPLFANEKYGVAYLYQPPFIQQSGIYARPGAEIPFGAIINYLQRHFSFWEIAWSGFAAQQINDRRIQQTVATNFVLPLQENYVHIASRYHSDLKKNLKRASTLDLQYLPVADYNYSIDLFIAHYADRTPHVTTQHYERFRKTCAYALEHDALICRQATNGQGAVLATALLLSDGKRLYNMMNTTTQYGRGTSANHFLMDGLIREFAGTSYMLDFEGSDLPGVRPFYENFGAVNERYFQLKYNQLPWPLRLFKR